SGCAVADDLGAVDVVGGQVGQRAVAAVLAFDAYRSPAGPWRSAGMDAASGLYAGLLVRADHIVVVAERLPIEHTGIQVQHASRLPGEVGVAREDHDRCCHGLRASLASHLRTVEADTETTMPRLAASAARSGQD